MAASVGRKRIAEPVTVRAPIGSIPRAGHPLQTTHCRPPAAVAALPLKGFPASSSGIGAVPVYRVLGVSTGGAGISIGGPE